MFRLEIETTNDAFQPSIASELEGILIGLSGKLFADAGTILDSNGNTVGKWSFTEE